MSRPAWSVGEELEETTLPPVTRLQLIKYAGASGDFNPIHTIDEEAKKAGLPGVIAHGMLTAATMGLPFSPYLEHGYARELRARFSAPVFVGDELAVGGRVSGAEEREKGTLYSFEMYARRGEEEVATGSVGFWIHG